MNDKKDEKKSKPIIWGDDPFELKDATLDGDSPSLKSEVDFLERTEKRKNKKEKEETMKVGLPRPNETTDQKEKTEKTEGIIKSSVEKRDDGHTEITLRSTDCLGGKALRDLMSLVLKDVGGVFFTVSDSGPIREVKITVPSEEEKKTDYSTYDHPPGSGGNGTNGF